MLINEKLGFKSWPLDILGTKHSSLWEQKLSSTYSETEAESFSSKYLVL